MDCDKTLEKISAYIDNALEAADRISVITHFQNCAPCRLEHLKLEKAKALLHSQPPFKMPKALHERIDTMIEHHEPAASAENAGSWLEALLPSPRLAMAGALAVAAFAWVIWTEVPVKKEPQVSLQRLLAEHTRSSRKSTSVQRAVLAAAPYDYISNAEPAQ